MNVKEEKEYIYQMMRDVTTERRELTKIYFQLKERLEELDKLELRGLEDLSIKGYVDLYNQNDVKVKEENLKREMNHLDSKNKEEQRKIEEPEDDCKIPKPIVSEDKFHKGKYSNVSIDRASSVVAQILQEAGIPLDTKKIYAEYDKKITEDGYVGVSYNNFRNNIINRIIKKNNRIERVARGTYQYKF